MPPRKAAKKRKSQRPPQPSPSEPSEARPSSPLTSINSEHGGDPRPASPPESVRSPMTQNRYPSPQFGQGFGQDPQFLISRPSLTVAITPFEETGIDFLQWKHKMTLSLRLRGTWDVVTGAYPKPLQIRDPGKLSDWLMRDSDAQQLIAMSVKGEAMNRVLLCSTAKDAWETLVDRYEGKGEKQITHLMGDLYRRNFVKSEPLEPQINQMLLVAQSLSTLGSPVPEKHLAFQLISALPDSLELLKALLDQIPHAELNTDRVIAMIIEDKKRRVRASGEPPSAFFAKAAKKVAEKTKEKDKSGEKGKHCTYCGRDGHEKFYCYKLQQDEKEKASKVAAAATAAAAPPPPANADANAATAAANLAKTDAGAPLIEVARLYLSTEAPKTTACGDQTVIALKTIELSGADVSNKWIMDSGTSCTMCSRREWFTYFNSLPSPISVVLGDNHSIPATGVGRVIVCMCAKGKWKHQMLQNVLYVPDLHGNLLS